MSQKLTISGEALTPSLEAALEAELFLQDNYLFRRNVLNGKLEFATLPAEVPVYRTLTQEALNSIVIRAKREDICEGKPKTDIMEVIHSEVVPVFNPVQDFLEHLPAWDGKNHVSRLFGRLPCRSRQSSTGSLPYGSARRSPTGCSWTPSTVTSAYLL